MTQVDTNTAQRVGYYDIAKGLLIISVVIGHLFTFDYPVTAAMKTVIYTFHMPAFLLISGMLMKPERMLCQRFGTFFKKKTAQLLIPYCFFEVISGLWQLLLLGTGAVNLVGILHGIVTIQCHAGADWFLPTLFFAEILVYLCLRLGRGRGLMAVAAAGLLLAWLLPDGLYALMCLRRVLAAVGFVILGMRGKSFLVRDSWAAFAAAAVCVAAASWVNGFVELVSCTFHNPILYLIGSIAGLYGILFLSRKICGRLGGLLQKTGRASLIIMGTHQMVMVAANKMYGAVYPIGLQLILCLVTLAFELVAVPICTVVLDKLRNVRILK